MKIKTDFVTNSSSTCYVLSAIVSGHLPRLSGDYGKLKEFYPTSQDFMFQRYAHIRLEGDVEKSFDVSEPEYNLDVQINDAEIFDDTNGNVKPITIFQLRIDLLNPYWNEIEHVVKNLIETILFKQLNETIPTSQLMYFAFPSSITGDGWDGGDPMGPSNEQTYKYEVYKEKTKMGILNIISSNIIIPEIRSIEQPLNLNEILLDNMNKEGFCLEEQNNDKNS